MTCAMYGANRDLKKKEVKLAGVRGKVQPVVITSQTLKIAKALDPDELKKIESFLATCVQRYWHDMKSMVGGVLLVEFAAFLKKIGTAWKRIPDGGDLRHPPKYLRSGRGLSSQIFGTSWCGFRASYIGGSG